MAVSRIAKSKTYVGEIYFHKTKVIFNEDGIKRRIKIPEEEWIKVEIHPIVPNELY